MKIPLAFSFFLFILSAYSKSDPTAKKKDSDISTLDEKIKITMSAWALFPIDNWCAIIGDMKRFELKDYLWNYVRIFMALQDAQFDPAVQAHSIQEAVTMVCTKWLISAEKLDIPSEFFDDRIDERFAERVRVSLEPLIELDENEVRIICQVFDHRHVIEFVTMYYRDILRISDTYDKYLCNIGNLKHFLETWLDICMDKPMGFFKNIINRKVDMEHFDCLLFKLFCKYKAYATSYDPKDIVKTTDVQKSILKLVIYGDVSVEGNAGSWGFFLTIFGIVGILGGSPLYSGAPIFASMASLRAGADLVYVFCDTEAAIPIKCYAPDIIVHATLVSSQCRGDYSSFNRLINRLNSLIVGPGLSNNENLQKQAEQLCMEALKNVSVSNFVLDADALCFLHTLKLLLPGKRCILTPNQRELHRMLQETLVDEFDCYLLVKGQDDLLYIPKATAPVKLNIYSGSVRRCGGQGDLLAGIIATLLAWMPNTKESTIAACQFACNVVRRANEIAFRKLQFATTTSDIMNYIGEAFKDVLKLSFDKNTQQSSNK